MKWFWPERVANECSNPQEDPYSDQSNSEKSAGNSDSSESCCKSHDGENDLHEHGDDSDESLSSEDNGRSYIVELKEMKQSEEESCSQEKTPEKEFAADEQTNENDLNVAKDSEPHDKEDEIEYEVSIHEKGVFFFINLVNFIAFSFSFPKNWKC